MKYIFLFSQLFIIISSINVPSFTIERINHTFSHCNYSTVNYHFAFIGNLSTDISEVINYDFELEQPTGYIAECSIDPNEGYPAVLYCIVDGYKYDISHSNLHNIFLPVKDPSTNAFKFENWEDKITPSTRYIVHDTNCPTKKIDYAFTFKPSPFKMSDCNGNKRKFSISCTRYNDISNLNDSNLDVYLYFGSPLHKTANCSVDLEPKDTSFNCEMQLDSPKQYIILSSLSGDEMNQTLKHIHIRGEELLNITFEKCEEKGSNDASHNYYIPIYLYLLVLIFLLL